MDCAKPQRVASGQNSPEPAGQEGQSALRRVAAAAEEAVFGALTGLRLRLHVVDRRSSTKGREAFKEAAVS